MKNKKKGKRNIEFRTIQDCCEICSLHAGHYFRGKHLLTYKTRFAEIDFYIDERGFICRMSQSSRRNTHTLHSHTHSLTHSHSALNLFKILTLK